MQQASLWASRQRPAQSHAACAVADKPPGAKKTSALVGDSVSLEASPLVILLP